MNHIDKVQPHSLSFQLAGLGACGIYSGGNELVCAMAAPDFDPQTPNGNPNKNTLCGRSISVTGPQGTVTVKVVDRCPVCKSVSEIILQLNQIINCFFLFSRAILI